MLRAFALSALLSASVFAQSPQDYSALTWRNLGPFRAGRISATSGAIGQAGTFYVGLPAGGVWKTTSAGETWYPIFDAVKSVSSIGAVEVAPSDPKTIYVGTGDMITGGVINEGDGVYKSTDAGHTWQHLGLEGTKQIPSIVVDPRDANVVMIAAQGDVHVRNDTRGVYRSTDGGKTWTKTLYVDDSTGIQKLARAYDVPDVIFATTVRHLAVPGARAVAPGGGGPQAGPSQTKIFKSTDNGLTWREIPGEAGGLPRLTGRTSIAIAQNTNAQRVYLIGNWGLYRSDDGGASWRRMDPTDRRIANGQGGYNCGVYVDPKNPDIVYTVNTAMYKSTDGGNTFTGFKGAPGGDDPQQWWLDPTDPNRMLAGYDQGAIVTLDGGTTWSSWYNQSTEQVYHVATDNSFPYWVYATQQDAGAIATRIRGNLGAITPLDWKPVPGWEWGTVRPDDRDPNTVYASGNGIVKISYPSELWINVSPAQDPALKARTTSSQPLVWSTWMGKRELLAGLQYVMSTTDGGAHWTKLSPDLGRLPKDSMVPGSIESLAASPVTPGVIWVGSNTNLIHVTRDHGKTWTEVSPPDKPTAFGPIEVTVEASPHDAGTAYAAFNTVRTGDYAPYIYRTHDFGKTWTRIVNGLPRQQPSGAAARVVREDPKRKGLLFAGTESGMYVSFDDGDNWQTLQQNLPNTSYRDITIHGNDVIVGTYGRGIWVLDDISVLRQLTPTVASTTHLFAPGDAVRLRRNTNADTPFPPEVPHALNPLDGATIYYTLASKPSSDITLDVLDSAGVVVRHLSSAPVAPVPEAAQPPEPNFWLATPQPLPASAGINRTNWDLRYDAPPAFTHTFEINANPGLTPASPEGPLVLPGTYTLRLTVDGKAYTSRVTVRPDPRSPASAADLIAQNRELMQIYAGARASYADYNRVAAMKDAIAKVATPNAPTDVATAAATIVARLDSIGGSPRPRGFGGGGFGGGNAAPTFVTLNNTLAAELNNRDNGDIRPNEASLAATKSRLADLKTAESKLNAIATKDVPALNSLLKQHGLGTVAAQ